MSGKLQKVCQVFLFQEHHKVIASGTGCDFFPLFHKPVQFQTVLFQQVIPLIGAITLVVIFEIFQVKETNGILLQSALGFNLIDKMMKAFYTGQTRKQVDKGKHPHHVDHYGTAYHHKDELGHDPDGTFFRRGPHMVPHRPHPGCAIGMQHDVMLCRNGMFVWPAVFVIHQGKTADFPRRRKHVGRHVEGYH